MKFLKVKLYLSLLLFTSIKCQTKFRLSNGTCSVFDQKAFTVRECAIKGLEANISVTLNRRLTKPLIVCNAFYWFFFPKTICFVLQLKVDYKQLIDQRFQKMLDVPPFDWCSITDTNVPNIFIKTMIEQFKKTIPEVIHECPYYVSRIKFSRFNCHKIVSILSRATSRSGQRSASINLECFLWENIW